MHFKHFWTFLSAIFLILFSLQQEWRLHQAEATINGFLYVKIQPPETKVKENVEGGHKEEEGGHGQFKIIGFADRMSTAYTASFPALQAEMNKKFDDQYKEGKIRRDEWLAKRAIFVRYRSLLPEGDSKIQHIPGNEGKNYGIAFVGNPEVKAKFNEEIAKLDRNEINKKSLLAALHKSGNEVSMNVNGPQQYAQTYPITDGRKIYSVQLGGNRADQLYDLEAKPEVKEIKKDSGHIEGFLSKGFKMQLELQFGFPKREALPSAAGQHAALEDKEEKTRRRTNFIVESDDAALDKLHNALKRHSYEGTHPNSVSGSGDMIIFHGPENRGQQGESAGVTCGHRHCPVEKEAIANHPIKSDQEMILELMSSGDLSKNKGRRVLRQLNKRDGIVDWRNPRYRTFSTEPSSSSSFSSSEDEEWDAHVSHDAGSPRNSKPPPVPSAPSSSRKEKRRSKKQKDRRNRQNNRQEKRQNRANRRRKNAEREKGK